jgi:hypothetical protein
MSLVLETAFSTFRFLGNEASQQSMASLLLLRALGSLCVDFLHYHDVKKSTKLPMMRAYIISKDEHCCWSIHNGCPKSRPEKHFGNTPVGSTSDWCHRSDCLHVIFKHSFCILLLAMILLDPHELNCVVSPTFLLPASRGEKKLFWWVSC